MGQSFLIVNTEKKEFLSPHDLGSGYKLIEISYNLGGILFYLTRKSSQGGGGDVRDRENREYLGRWANNRVVTIGDYDESGLYDEVSEDPEYTRLDPEKFANEFNDFMGEEKIRPSR